MTRMKALTSVSIESFAVEGPGLGSSADPNIKFPESLMLRLRISRGQGPSTQMVRETALLVPNTALRRRSSGVLAISYSLLS